MDLTTNTTYVLPTLLVSLLAYISYQRYFSPLAPVPGPFLASITSLWIAHAYWRQDFHRYVTEVHNQYGPVVRVAPDGISTSDVNAIKVIYGTGSKFWKGRWYSHVGRSPNNLIGMTDEQRHKQHRRLVDPMYTLKSVRESESLMNKPVAFFAEQMKRMSGQDIDIVEWGNVLAVDAFTAMTYGKAYGLLEKGRDPLMLAFTERNWNPYFWAAMLPGLGRLLRLFQKAIMITNVTLSGGKPPLPILGWTAGQIEKAFTEEKNNDSPYTLLDKTMRLHQERPADFSADAVKAHMFEVLFAGFETCGATVPKIIWRIATTDGCQAKLQRELRAAKRGEGLDGPLSYDELCQSPYLSACISEGMRMDPITGISLSRKVPADGVEMNGYHLPGGTEIGITPWVIAYNNDVFSKPHEFKPERWIEADDERKMLMHRMDLMFSAGPASCPGKVMALAFMHKVVATVFSNFDVAAVDPQRGIEEINIFPVKWRNVKMRLRSRTHNHRD